jgi:hypothetical protein
MGNTRLMQRGGAGGGKTGRGLLGYLGAFAPVAAAHQHVSM